MEFNKVFGGMPDERKKRFRAEGLLPKKEITFAENQWI